MLCQLSESLKEMGNQLKVEDSTYHVARVSTMEELANVERDMKDPSNRLHLVSNGEKFYKSPNVKCITFMIRNG